MHKALSNILQQYLRQETLVTGENGAVDEELLESLHKSLEEKGVLKEVHAFLRKRLVAVLEGTWPNLFDHFRTDGDLNPIVLKLIEDFLCSHKLLFTLSILTTELGNAFCPKVGFAKLASLDAQGLLFNLGIRPDSVLSQRILENYATKGTCSLIECLITFFPFGTLEQKANGPGREEINSQSKNILTLDEKLRKIDEKKHTNFNRVTENLRVDQRFRHLALDLERDKQIQLQIAIDKFKSEEKGRIRAEIETEQKFELLRKENELLANYEQKVTHMRNNLEREKKEFLGNRQKERKILDMRDLAAFQGVHVKPKSVKIFMEASVQTEDQVPETVMYEVPTFMFPRTLEQKEMERVYLLREAKLKLQIEKLQQDNRDRMVIGTPVEEDDVVEPSEGDASCHHDRHCCWPPPTSVKSPRKSKLRPKISPIRRASGEDDKWTRHFAPPAPESDTVAVLRYQLESQNEEIQKLRIELQNGISKVSPRTKESLPSRRSNASPPAIPKALEMSDVDTFLREAKQRIFDIDQEAHLVEETLRKIHNGSGEPSVTFIPRAKVQLSTLCPIPQKFTLPSSVIQHRESLRNAPNVRSVSLGVPIQLATGSRSIPPMPPIEKKIGSNTELHSEFELHQDQTSRVIGDELDDVNAGLQEPLTLSSVKPESPLHLQDDQSISPFQESIKTIQEEPLHKEKGEMDMNLSLESSAEKASRSGALVKNKLGRNAGVSGSESISSTLKSSSAGSSALPKSVETLEKEAKNIEAESERFDQDSKANRISPTPSPTFSKDLVLKPQFSRTKNFMEEDLDLDDLGTLETSDDVPIEENLFWRM